MTARRINTTAVGQETTIKGIIGMKNLKMLARKHAMPVQVRDMTYYNTIQIHKVFKVLKY